MNYDNTHIQDYLEENKIDDNYIIKYGLQNKHLDVQWQITEIKDAITYFNIFYKDDNWNFPWGRRLIVEQ